MAPTASVRVSPLCLGALTFGDQLQDLYGQITKEEAFKILDEFYSCGGNFIDTASAYQRGQSEEWLGEWMASRGNRDDIVLATKYSTGYKLHQKDRLQVNYGGNGTKSMRLALEDSLKKLQTNYVDVFYLHWWDFTATIEEVMQSLNDLVASGKVIYLGISDAPAWVVTKANQYARMAGLRQFVVYQGMWSAALRDFERDIVPMCASEGMGIAPYGVLNQGRFQTEEGWREREKPHGGRNYIQPTARDRQVSKVLETMAVKKGVKILDVALAYVRQKAPYVFPIVGARTVGHIRGSIAGLEVSLTDEEMEQVDKSYDFDHGFPHTFLSGSLVTGDRPWGATGPGDTWLTKQLGNIEWVEALKPLKP
ncbi:hypothetical protein CkaCkLH20_04260 [Colletotrichum karsti]|uniref:NADP-dependent oxidoreductase domain-containing protein n=1 Tax=Colletotrichum karsti TaxID=1095194 RepID=A0A9P6LN65_9PEZI|nr:uncharacterized protein CkaCkLH20_04260 [Colletotrichum karsti]KAF9878222.1 hypothetical protein CkaCkLH20_04260 [Colletotrichum karsti]